MSVLPTHFPYILLLKPHLSQMLLPLLFQNLALLFSSPFLLQEIKLISSFLCSDLNLILMATPLMCSLFVTIRAQSGSISSRKPDLGRGRPAASKWWGPLFGWSSDPDYVNTSNAGEASQKKPDNLDLESEQSRPRSRFPRGCLTEEKAKQLRRKNIEIASFHDIMYHSAIASRLASDVSDRLEK